VALIVTVSGSPSTASRTLLLARHVNQRLQTDGFEVGLIDVRALPAEDLLAGHADAPGIREAVALLDRAQGVVVATPVYKAAYSGLLKTFLDLLPQFGLQGKSVLPIATGGSLAHVLSIDYALRPVLASLAAGHVTNGYFFLDKQLERVDGDQLRIEAVAEQRFEPIYRDFIISVQLYDRARRDRLDSSGDGVIADG
jgi:FMN reductase